MNHAVLDARRRVFDAFEARPGSVVTTIEVERILSELYQTGYDAGYDEGHADARDGFPSVRP